MSKFGYAEGDTCKRQGCAGVVDTHPVDNCSCHLCAPCNACTSPRNFCPECGWEESEDEVFNDYIVNVDRETGVFRSYELRPLDRTKIDWHSYGHSSGSMIKRGVYPEGTTATDVRKLVDGTFGGRFNYFRNGEFEFIAYTD